MHILLIVNSYPSEWHIMRGIFYADQAKALHEAGHQVGVIVEPSVQITIDYSLHHLHPPPLIRVTHKQHEIPIYRGFWAEIPKASIDLRVKAKLWLTRKIFQRYCKKFGYPDIIHAHNTIYSGYISTILGDENNIPVVITEHSSAFVRNLIKDGQKPFIRQALDNAYYRVAVSNSLKTIIQNYTHQPITVQPNMVDTDFFTSKKPSNKDTFVFSIIGELNENKRHALAIQAFAQAFEDSPVTLQIIGDGVLREALEAYVNTLSLADRVSFRGMLSREEIRSIIHQSHCIVSVSRVETFGVSLIEALSCGRPVIATRSGGPEMFVNDTNGILVPIDDGDALSNAMQYMRENFTSYNSEQIRVDTVRQFSKDVLVKNLESIYRDVLKFN